MSNLIPALIIALVQGITEWLPISSSGHIILVEKLLGYKGGMTFDVALHFGTLMSVFAYFGKDITDIIQDMIKLNFKTQNAKLGLYLIIATLPAALIGFFFKEMVKIIFTDLKIVALGFGITGIILVIASLDIHVKKQKLTVKNALTIGIAQIFSLFPGISRSGATISTGMLLGLEEKTALKFSFLMSIPIVFGANLLVIGNQTLPPELIWATLLSFITGLLTLHIFYKYILTTKRNLRWFGIYALVLAITVALSQWL